MKKRELEKLIQDLFENKIDEMDFARLEEELSLDEQSRVLYRDYAFLHSQLLSQEGSGVIDLSQVKENKRSSISKLRSYALVASLVLLGVFVFFGKGRWFAESSQFSSSPDSKVLIRSEGTSRSMAKGKIAMGSSMEVSQGTVELSLDSGVKAIVAAPANLTLTSDNLLDLHEGTAWFHVPEEKTGFQVRTGGLLITDQGTEFGVIHVPGSTDEVHVLDGSVDTETLSGLKERETLETGQARAAGFRGDLVTAPLLQNPFTTHLPSRLPYLHFPFDEIEGGETVARGEHPFLDQLAVRIIQSDDREAVSRIVPGRFGTAISFDGAGDFVTTNWSGAFGSQPVTISFWMKPAGAPNFAGIVAWGASKQLMNDNEQWKLVYAPYMKSPDDGFEWFRCSWGREESTGVEINFPYGTWSHVAMVYSGETGRGTPTISYYYNGRMIKMVNNLKASPPRRPSDLNQAFPLTFGYPIDMSERAAYFLENFFHGALDEIFIIEGSLTESQIEQLYLKNQYGPESSNEG